MSLKHKIARANYYLRKLEGDANPARYSPPRRTIFDKLGVKPKRKRLEEI